MIKHFRDTITTRLALLGVALAGLALATLVAIESYYRATYRDETSAQLVAFSIQTFRLAAARLGPGQDIILSQGDVGLGPRFETEVPQYSAPWRGVFLERNIRKALGEPEAKIEVRNAPLSPRSLWVGFEAAGKTYWVTLPLGVEGRPKPIVLLLIATAILAGLAGTAGYVLVVLPVNRLQKIVTSAQLNAPDRPLSANKREPREIQAVLAAFDALIARLSAQAAQQNFALGAISHDLRSPLARLRMRLETQPSDELRIAGAQDIEQIDAVLGQFLAYVRGGEQLGPRQPISSILTSLKDHYKGRPVAFVTPPAVAGTLNSEAVIRLLTNLIDNALQYGRPPVQVIVQYHDHSITFQIVDSGEGFSAEQEAQARSPFVRLETSRSSSGSGLGLAIVDRLASAMDGSVRFEREEREFRAIVNLPMT